MPAPFELIGFFGWHFTCASFSELKNHIHNNNIIPISNKDVVEWISSKIPYIVRRKIVYEQYIVDSGH